MELRSNSGWRKLPPSQYLLNSDSSKATRAELFRAKELAIRALGLQKSSIAVLSALISFFKEPLNGRLIVWPSNAAITLATGYKERAIRLAIKDLIDQGLLLPKDSANGKRFPIKRRDEQVIDAFGFDLSALFERRHELAEIAKAKAIEQKEISRGYDEITIFRRTVEEVIRALEEFFPEIDTEAHRQRFDALCAVTPRRSPKRVPESVSSEWKLLKDQTESLYIAANAGKQCRLIENNKYPPERPCQSGDEKEEGENPITIAELHEACPDAFKSAGTIRNERDLVHEAGYLRGGFGISRDAWREAESSIGIVPAAVLFFLTLQILENDQRGKRTITNFGGLYRSYMRRVAACDLKIEVELRQMRRKRQH